MSIFKTRLLSPWRHNWISFICINPSNQHMLLYTVVTEETEVELLLLGLFSKLNFYLMIVSYESPALQAASLPSESPSKSSPVFCSSCLPSFIFKASSKWLWIPLTYILPYLFPLLLYLFLLLDKILDFYWFIWLNLANLDSGWFPYFRSAHM